jgi:hypothetical protein
LSHGEDAVWKRIYRRHAGRAQPPDEERLRSWVEEVLWNPDDRWVLFRNGTVVFSRHLPAGDVEQEARKFLSENGRVVPGTSLGDFGVYDAVPTGWLVTGDQEGMATYVHPTEIDKDDHLSVGLLGRSKRHRDSQELVIVHVKH